MGAGKWIGGVLGFITGGPLGALAGYALGSLFEHGLNEVNRQDTGQQLSLIHISEPTRPY